LAPTYVRHAHKIGRYRQSTRVEQRELQRPRRTEREHELRGDELFVWYFVTPKLQ
jgi:hypothetical protein